MDTKYLNRICTLKTYIVSHEMLITIENFKRRPIINRNGSEPDIKERIFLYI